MVKSDLLAQSAGALSGNLSNARKGTVGCLCGKGGLFLEREIDAIPLQICTHPPGTPGYRDQIDIGQILDAGWNLAPPCHRCLGDLEQRERVRGQ